MILIMMKQRSARSAAADEPVYSIQTVLEPTLSCTDCGQAIAAGGPVGYRDDRPVCDICLFEASADLGMVVALIAVCRCYARASNQAPEDQLGPLRELGNFARVYECFAAKTAPMRIFRVPGFADGEDVR